MNARRGARGISVYTLFDSFPDEQGCLLYVFYTRHQLRPRCPRCGQPAAFRLLTSQRSVMSLCCFGILSPTARTILHCTRIPLRMWFYAILLVTSLGSGTTQGALRRQLGLSPKHAWALADRIRTHIALSLPTTPLGGDGRTVCIDEAKIHIGPERRALCLFGISDGVRCRIFIVPDRSRRTLFPIICENIVPGARVVSDGWSTYRSLGALGFQHSRVIHRKMEWVNAAGESTAHVENVWSATRSVLRGKSGQIAEQNLWKFLAEIMHRYNSALDPAAAWWELIGAFRTIGEEDLERARRSIDRRPDRRRGRRDQQGSTRAASRAAGAHGRE